MNFNHFKDYSCKMKLLLISLQSNASFIGLKYVAGSARAHGHDVKVLLLPGYLDKTLHPVIEGFISQYNPHLIGISLMSIEFYPAKNITRLLKERFKIPIIWGGVHAIIKPDECIRYADYICCGEGEGSIVSLLNYLEKGDIDGISEIPNIWVNTNGMIIKKSDIKPEPDLNSLPIIEYLPEYLYGFYKGRIYNFAKDPRLYRRYSLYGGTCHMTITTRGCPFNCAYCANAYLTKVFGRKIRERSVEHCIKELIEVKKDPYVIYINFEDDWFFAHSHDWIREFCRDYKRYVNLPFMVRAFPGVMEREKLFMLRDAGMSVVVMGIQTGSDRVNFEVYNRKVRFSSVVKAVELINESKAAPYYEMIVDNPYETEEDQMECINAMANLQRPFTISLAHLTFFPGTPLTEKALNDKKIDPEDYMTRFMVHIDKTYFNKLLYMTPYIPRVLIKYLNRPKAMRRFHHVFINDIMFFLVKRTIEPAVFFFVLTRGLRFNLKWTIRTLLGNWRSAIVKIIFNFLSKSDMEFEKRQRLARREVPLLFEE